MLQTTVYLSSHKLNRFLIEMTETSKVNLKWKSLESEVKRLLADPNKCPREKRLKATREGLPPSRELDPGVYALYGDNHEPADLAILAPSTGHKPWELDGDKAWKGNPQMRRLKQGSFRARQYRSNDDSSNHVLVVQNKDHPEGIDTDDFPTQGLLGDFTSMSISGDTPNAPGILRMSRRAAGDIASPHLTDPNGHLNSLFKVQSTWNGEECTGLDFESAIAHFPQVFRASEEDQDIIEVDIMAFLVQLLLALQCVIKPGTG